MERFHLTSLLLLCVSLFAHATEARPNILLILSDDHSLPHLGAYGSENCERFNLTPHLDAFAAESMRFDRAYTAAPQCAPSRTSIFAGRSPVGLSSTRFAQPARGDVRFVTDQLRDDGYWVGLDGRHQHLDGRYKDVHSINQILEDLEMRGDVFEARFDHFVRGAKTKGDDLPQVGETVDAILETVPEGQPWFLYYGFNQPHRKWGEDHDGIDPAQLILPPDWPDMPEVRLDYARYLAEVRDLDTGFGLVMDVLKRRQLVDNTIVIFMGDNGEALLRGKGTLNTRGLHVPLLVRWPEHITPGSSSEQLISGVDLAPTILAAANAPIAEGMTGQSFLPELKGQSFAGREQVFAERGWHFGPIDRTNGLDFARSVTTDRYHYIYTAIPERKFAPVDMTKKNIAWDAILAAHEQGSLTPLYERLYFTTPRPVFELYDLEQDPFQLSNLAGLAEHAAIEANLRSKLDAWMVRESDYLPLPSHIVPFLK